jgi:glycyl-tRNA synthetase
MLRRLGNFRKLGPLIQLRAMASVINKTAHPFSKANLDDLLLKRFFYAPAFEIYGGVAGLYDYGPPGSALQANIIAEWRKHFIIEESMLELDTTIMTPEKVFIASGHVAKFADWMVKDVKTGEVLRADHLVKNVLNERLDQNKALQDAPADAKKKSKKEVVKPLEADVKAEYESILNRVCNVSGMFCDFCLMLDRWTSTLALSLEISSRSTL